MNATKNHFTGIVANVLFLLVERRTQVVVALLIALALIATGHGHALAGHRTPGG